MQNIKFIANSVLSWTCVGSFALVFLLIGSPRPHTGEVNAALASWRLDRLAYDIEEHWVPLDPSNPRSSLGQEMLESHIEIRSGDRLRTKKKVDGGSFPVWSPSGRRIAFLGSCGGCAQIFVMNADGSNRRLITRPPVGRMTPRTNSWVTDLSWSPQESKIAYVERTLSFSPTPSSSSTIFTLNSDGSGQTEVAKVADAQCHFTTSSAREVKSLTVHPSWSPDGLDVAFETCVEGEPAIAIVDKDGNNRRLLAKGGYGAVWSTDGKRLLYLHGPTAHDATISICIIGLDGKNLTRIFNGHFQPSGVTWLPDGKSIAFVSLLGNRADVFQIDIDGTALRSVGSVSNKGFALTSPTFSPDGKELVVSGYRCCPNIYDNNWSATDRSAVILLDLTSKQQRIIAKGLHPSVQWKRE